MYRDGVLHVWYTYRSGNALRRLAAVPFLTIGAKLASVGPAQASTDAVRGESVPLGSSPFTPMGAIGPCDSQRIKFSSQLGGNWRIRNCFSSTKRVMVFCTDDAGTIIIGTSTGCLSLCPGLVQTGSSATSASWKYC